MDAGGMEAEPHGFAFLFKTDQGRIGRAVWWRGTLGLGIPLGVLWAIWTVLYPFANRSVDAGDRLFDPMVFVTYAYLLVFTVAVLLIGISHYNLSAKRWRDRGRLPGLAGLLPLLALFDGAARWLQPRVADVMPIWFVVMMDALLVAWTVWNIWELGFRTGPSSRRTAGETLE